MKMMMMMLDEIGLSEKKFPKVFAEKGQQDTAVKNFGVKTLAESKVSVFVLQSFHSSPEGMAQLSSCPDVLAALQPALVRLGAFARRRGIVRVRFVS